MTKFLTDIIKIKYIEQGYLSGYPYWMTTDKEMTDAFLMDDGYFAVNYPLVDPSLEDQYNELLDAIKTHIAAYHASNGGIDIPYWVLSYMIGSAISISSDPLDIEYLKSSFNLPTTSSQFDAELAQNCYRESVEWIQKLPPDQRNRPATMFGEPHVVKSLRLKEVNIVGG